MKIKMRKMESLYTFQTRKSGEEMEEESLIDKDKVIERNRITL